MRDASERGLGPSSWAMELGVTFPCAATVLGASRRRAGAKRRRWCGTSPNSGSLRRHASSARRGRCAHTSGPGAAGRANLTGPSHEGAQASIASRA
jgi:hypothetical protein